MTIKCARWRSKVFRYEKIGEARVLHCWKNRIIKDCSVRDGSEVKCECGNLIGIDEGKWIRMKRRAFTCSGAEEKDRYSRETPIRSFIFSHSKCIFIAASAESDY